VEVAETKWLNKQRENPMLGFSDGNMGGYIIRHCSFRYAHTVAIESAQGKALCCLVRKGATERREVARGSVIQMLYKIDTPVGSLNTDQKYLSSCDIKYNYSDLSNVVSNILHISNMVELELNNSPY